MNNLFFSHNFTITSATTYTFGRVVGVCSSGTLLRAVTSDDAGMTWVNRATPTSGLFLAAPAWSPTLGIFVAAAWADTTTTAVMTSPTGVVWTSRTSISAGFLSCTWIPELGKFFLGSGDVGIEESTNGITWTTSGNSNTVLAAMWIGRIMYSPTLGILVAAGHDTTTCAWSDNGGVTWTKVVHTATTGDKFRDGCWSPELGKFFVGASANLLNCDIVESSDGKNWSLIRLAAPVSGAIAMGIDWSPTLGLLNIAWQAGAAFTNPTSYSATGSTWTMHAATASVPYGLGELLWMPEYNRFLACASTGQNALYSTDGITYLNGGVQPQTVRSICIAPGLGA